MVTAKPKKTAKITIPRVIMEEPQMNADLEGEGLPVIDLEMVNEEDDQMGNQRNPSSS